MEIVTKKMLIASTANRWKRRIFRARDNEIYKALCRLNPPTEKAIIEIIGNDSWTRNECDECKKDCQIVVQVGEEPDYESCTANICLNCLEKAAKLAKNEKV